MRTTLAAQWSQYEAFAPQMCWPWVGSLRNQVAGMRVLSECTTSCLTDAVQQRQFPMVDLLLRHAADVNVVDEVRILETLRVFKPILKFVL